MLHGENAIAVSDPRRAACTFHAAKSVRVGYQRSRAQRESSPRHAQTDMSNTWPRTVNRCESKWFAQPTVRPLTLTVRRT